jgi:hypothetical protein
MNRTDPERVTRLTTTTLTLTASVRSNGGALPLFNGEIPPGSSTRR